MGWYSNSGLSLSRNTTAVTEEGQNWTRDEYVSYLGLS